MIASAPLRDATRRIRARVDRDTLTELARPRHARIALDLFVDWAAIVGAVVLVARVDAVWAWVVAFAVIGSCQYRLFVLGHEALHGCLHADRGWNDRIARWLIYGPLLTGFDDSRRGHIRHHDRLGSADDPERYLYGLANKNSRARILLLCSGLLTFARTLERVVPYRALREPRGVAAAARQRIPVLVAQAVILAALLALGLPWFTYPLLWLAPIYVLVFVPDEVRSFCDHAVLALPDDAADAARLVTYRPPWLERLVFAPHNLHYQAEHHLFPELPYHALPRVHAIVGDDPAITVRPGYVAFLWRTLRAVPVRAGGPDAVVEQAAG